MNTILHFFESKKLTIVAALLLSILMIAYGPMSSISHAQSAVDSSKLKSLKEKATEEIDRRIAQYQETLKNLAVDITLNNDELDASASNGNGTSGSVTANQDGVDTNVEVSNELQDKVRSFLEKFVEQLQSMKEKVTEAGSLDTMESLADTLDTQFSLDQLANVQASVTQAIESMTGVLDTLKTTAGDLQSQITKAKECAKGIQSDESSASANIGNGNANVDASAPGCDDFSINSEDLANQAQSQLDTITTQATTIASVITSAIALVTTLIASFSGIMGGLGNLGSLGNIGNIGNLAGGGGDLSSITGSLGNVTGLLGSFSAITSQLDIANGMSGNAFNGLSSLTSLINI